MRPHRKEGVRVGLEWREAFLKVPCPKDFLPRMRQLKPVFLKEYHSVDDEVTGLQCLWRCGWDETNSHELLSPVEEKEWHHHCLKRRVRWPLPWQAFIAFLGTLHWEWSSFTTHRFALGGYLLQKTKERMLLITSKKEGYWQRKGKSGWTGYTQSLEGLA